MYLGAFDEPLDITVSDLAARQLRDYFQGIREYILPKIILRSN